MSGERGAVRKKLAKLAALAGDADAQAAALRPKGEGRYRLSKARTHGAARLLAARRDRVRDLAGRAQAEGQVEFAASLRGKARAYDEAVRVVEALENDRPLPPKSRQAATPEVVLDGPSFGDYWPADGEVGTGAGEGATGQDTGTAWVTRSADYPEAPAQAHLPAAPAVECEACGVDLRADGTCWWCGDEPEPGGPETCEPEGGESR